jgi:hypothetical protein
MKTRSISIIVPAEAPADPPEGYTLTEYFVGEIDGLLICGESFQPDQLNAATGHWVEMGIASVYLYAIAKKGDETLTNWYVPLFSKWLGWAKEDEEGEDQP